MTGTSMPIQRASKLLNCAHSGTPVFVALSENLKASLSGQRRIPEGFLENRAVSACCRAVFAAKSQLLSVQSGEDEIFAFAVGGFKCVH